MSLSRKSSFKKAMAILLIFMVALVTLMPHDTAAAESAITKDEAYAKVGEYLSGVAEEKGLKANNEWFVIGLARADLLNDDQTEEYYKSVETYVDGIINEKGQLKKSTDSSRIILALTAIGKDVTDVGGHNLLAGLSDLDYVKKSGINGSVYTLLALDSHRYEIPAVAEGGTQATRENIIDTILEKQLADGGFALFGTKGDPDITAMTVQALAPYYNTDPEVKTAVDKAMDCLSAIQTDNGGYAESFSKKVNAPSCAQVLVALTAMGIDPTTDARFLKNGNSVVDALLGFYVDGGFGYTSNAKIDPTASTQQGYYALVAYDRMLSGKTALYDMSDVKIGGEEEPVDPVDPADPTNPVDPSKPTESGDVNNQEPGTAPADNPVPVATTVLKTGDDSNITLWIVAALVALAAVILVFIKKKKS